MPHWPEVWAHIADAPAFYLALLPAGSGITGTRIEIILAGEGQEARVEADQSAVVFGHGGRQIVIPTFAPLAAQSLKSVEVATDEGLEALTVSELHKEHSAAARRRNN